jgi:hypothetical protein
LLPTSYGAMRATVNQIGALKSIWMRVEDYAFVKFTTLDKQKIKNLKVGNRKGL